MKIAVCISNEEISLKHTILSSLSKYIIRKNYNWGEKFGSYLDKSDIKYEYVYIDRHDWIEKLEEFDIVMWKPAFMGVRSTGILKEKIYFIQNVMKKRIYPNFETVWHFDSKISQSYFLKYKNIKSPSTFVSFDYNDAMENLKKFNYPVVIKNSNGAGSTGVRLVRTIKDAAKIINRNFVFENIFARKISSKLFDRFGEVYIQEFLPNNSGDLRVTIIGDKFATGFWRKNRDNDFRASGSGKIDYENKIPIEIIKYCSQISKENNFDSMAYDILFQGDNFLIVEMSYGYNDTAIYNSKGYYELDNKGEVTNYIQGNHWPQELWIKWVIENEEIKI